MTLGYSKTPLFLVVPAALTALAIAMPLTYLVIPTSGVGGEQLLALVSRPRTVAVYQMPMLVFAYVVLFLPQSVGTVRSSLLQVNPQLEESARSLGKTPWQALKAITLPLVRAGVLVSKQLDFFQLIKITDAWRKTNDP